MKITGSSGNVAGHLCAVKSAAQILPLTMADISFILETTMYLLILDRQ